MHPLAKLYKANSEKRQRTKNIKVPIFSSFVSFTKTHYIQSRLYCDRGGHSLWIIYRDLSSHRGLYIHWHCFNFISLICWYMLSMMSTDCGFWGSQSGKCPSCNHFASWTLHKLYKTEESDSSPKKTLNKSAGLHKTLLYNDKVCLCPDQVTSRLRTRLHWWSYLQIR